MQRQLILLVFFSLLVCVYSDWLDCWWREGAKRRTKPTSRKWPSPKANGIIRAGNNPCPSGWSIITHGDYNDSFCYYSPPGQVLGWDPARNACLALGGDLVSFDNSGEYNQLLQIYTSNASSLYLTWTGFHLYYDYFWGDEWEWSDGLWYGYEPWLTDDGEPPQPDGYSNCSGWRTTGDKTGLQAIACHYQQPFLCKQDAGGCNGGNFSSYTNKGTVTSPNFPNGYYNNLDCIYNIHGSAGTSIYISFSVYAVEEDWDTVTIYDGPTTNSRVIAIICNGDEKLDFESTGPDMTIRFETDEALTDKGWSADWLAKANLPDIFYNDTNAGTLTSPNYPNNYPYDVDQVYYVVAPDTFHISVSIKDFDTETRYDVLYIFDGPKADFSTPPTYNFSGWSYSLPINFVTNTSTLSMRFQSDYALSYKGWSLDWFWSPSPVAAKPPFFSDNNFSAFLSFKCSLIQKSMLPRPLALLILVTLLIDAVVSSCWNDEVQRAEKRPHLGQKPRRADGIVRAGNNPCPAGWSIIAHGTYNDSFCYYSPPGQVLGWDAARNACLAIGGDLVSFDNVDEYNQLLQIYNANTSSLYLTWAGFRLEYDDFWEDWDWEWSDGTYWGYEPWLTDDDEEPPQDGYSNCSAWRTTGERTGIQAMGCHYQQPFLCKQDAGECNGGNITSSTNKGTITSPGYPNGYYNNLDCLYFIHGKPGMSIYVNFKVFVVEYHYDIITLYDGPSTDSRVIAQICDGDSKLDFESTGPDLTVRFTTDYGKVDKGWSADWVAKANLPTVYINDTNAGTLASPNYPGDYPTNVDQLFFVVAPEGFKVSVSITDFKTETRYDTLFIFDGPTADFSVPPIYNFTGSSYTLPFNFTTNSTTLSMRFQTDYIVCYKGWSLNWVIV